MSEEKTTHFQFNLEGIELEISGEQSFVELMYRRIMRDIEEARSLPASGSSKVSRATQPLPAAPKAVKQVRKESRPVIWVHRCTEMMHKIYMSSPEDIARAPLFRSLESDWISVIYTNEHAITHVIPNVEAGHTLWAELTDAGRARIKNAKAG